MFVVCPFTSDHFYFQDELRLDWLFVSLRFLRGGIHLLGDFRTSDHREVAASLVDDLAPRAGEVPAALVVADEASQMEGDAIEPGQFHLSIPVIDSVFHSALLSEISASFWPSMDP